jgi:hypothetical protein
MYFQRVLSVFIVITGIMLSTIFSQSLQEVKTLVDQGEFSQAREMIYDLLQHDPTLADSLRLELTFELERMNRIRKDFTKTEQEVLQFIKQYILDATSTDLRRWEKEKSLEYKIIDGEKRYFEWAGRNLFRIDPEAKQIWSESHQGSGREEEFDLDGHISKILKRTESTKERYNSPVRLRICYALTVNKNAVPDGEIIRCWIPYPREIPKRQINIKYIKSDPAKHIIAPNEQSLQRTIYLEKPAKKDQKATFSVEYEYTSYGNYVAVDPKEVQPIKQTEELAPYLKELPPHIVFIDKMRRISEEIIGDETNPYRIVQNLFAWVDAIPWASAREYSTFRNISDYCVTNKHGDCGIQTLTFMTLCRMNGIPTKWQSGWEFKPPNDSMHDWGQIYFEPYGWVPMDVSYGQRDSKDDRLKWFYLGGMDSYRLIFNDAYSQPFYPIKIHHRSETIDSQRGEVEWRGGNLYFDQWSWDFDWKIVEKE